MNKKLLLVVGIALLAAGCGKSAPAQPQAQSKPAVLQASGQGSFKDLLTAGKSQKCESSFGTPNGNYSGTAYFASGKMFGDFTAQVMGKTNEFFMVIKDQSVYTWLEVTGKVMGFKTALPAATTTPATTAQSGTAADVNQKITYTCQNWNEDDSFFALPADVTFKDMPAAASPAVNTKKCSVCDTAPASVKAQCLAALNCK